MRSLAGEEALPEGKFGDRPGVGAKARAHRDGAASYIHKGRDLDDFLRAVEAIREYWCRIANLPDSPDANR